MDLVLFDIVVALTVISLSSCDPQQGKYLKGRTMQVIKIIGRNRCKKECTSVTNCLSYNYDRITLTCELNTDTVSTGLVESRQNSYFEEKSDFTPEEIDPCSRGNCTKFSKCVPLSNGNIKCVPYVCSNDPPVIANAKKTTVGTHFVTGTNVTYTCDEGYFLIGVPQLTCKANGNWTTVGFSCKAPWCQNTVSIFGTTVRGSETYLGSSRTVECDAGYKQTNGSGPETSTCLENRQWSTLNITCAKCPTLGSTFTLRKNMLFNPPGSYVSMRGYISVQFCTNYCINMKNVVCVAVYFKNSSTGKRCILRSERVHDQASYSQHYNSNNEYNEYIRNCA